MFSIFWMVLILILSYCLCGVLHVLPVSMWVDFGFFGFPPKTHRGRWIDYAPFEDGFPQSVPRIGAGNTTSMTEGEEEWMMVDMEWVVKHLQDYNTSPVSVAFPRLPPCKTPITARLCFNCTECQKWSHWRGIVASGSLSLPIADFSSKAVLCARVVYYFAWKVWQPGALPQAVRFMWEMKILWRFRCDAPSLHL